MLRVIEENRFFFGSMFFGAAIVVAAFGTLDIEARHEQHEAEQPIDQSHHEKPPVERYEPSITDDKDVRFVCQPPTLVRGRDYPVTQ